MNTRYLNLRFVLVFLVLAGPLRSVAQVPDDVNLLLTPDTAGAVSGVFFILLPDTTDLHEIKIQLGSTEGDSNLVNSTFVYDVATGLPPGFSWYRNGKSLYLGVGAFTLTDLRFGKVRLRRVGQSWGSEYAFVTN